MEEKSQSSTTQTPQVPENFRSTISDFAKDLQTTFPEYKENLVKWTNPETDQKEFQDLFSYCLGVYPQRFFDILNQNASLFDTQSEEAVNTYFLPNIDFKELYHCADISDKTRETIWKYLQIVLFVLVGTMKDKMDFGEAMNMFDEVKGEDLEGKLQDAMGSIHEFFTSLDKEGEDKKEAGEEGSQERTGPNVNMPPPEEIHDHLMGLFNGKIGKLAKELASDLTSDLEGSLGFKMDDVSSSQDVLKKLMQNPSKISGLVKTVGDKLTEKMSGGEISQQELLSEAGDMMRKMKDMGGGNMGDLFKNMAKTMGMNMPKGARFNQSAFDQMQKSEEVKERLRQKAADSQQIKEAEKIIQERERQKREEDYAKFMAANPNIFDTNDPNSLVYRLEGETQEKSGLKPPSSASNKKKKANKKKKGKK